MQDKELKQKAYKRANKGANEIINETLRTQINLKPGDKQAGDRGEDKLINNNCKHNTIKTE